MKYRVTLTLNYDVHGESDHEALDEAKRMFKLYKYSFDDFGWDVNQIHEDDDEHEI